MLVGTLAHLEERERVRIEGTWHDDKRFGMQVKVRLRRAGGAVGRAGADRVPQARPAHRGRAGGDGCWSATARACWRRSTTIPRRAFRTVGLNPKRVNEAIRSWNALRSTRALHLLLAPHGLAWLVPRIATEYGDRAHEVVRERARTS